MLDANFYASVYDDVDIHLAVDHWHAKGKQQGRVSSREMFYYNFSDFNYIHYIRNNPGARYMSGESWEYKAIKHFLLNDSVKVFFDSKHYLSKYPDLKASGIDNHDKAYTHWLNNGMVEGRSFTNLTFDIYQVYYDKKQEENLIPGLKPYLNTNTSLGFESGVMCDIHDKNGFKNDWCGLFSWKLNNKLSGNNITYTYIIHMIEEHKQHDIITISPKKYWNDVLREKHCASRDDVHGSAFLALLVLLDVMKCDGIIQDDIPYTLDDDINRIYCNYFIARKDVYHDYIENFLKPALDILMNHEKMKKIGLLHSGYTEPVPESFMKKTGCNYYPFLPFILERMINVYIQIKNCKVAYCL